MPILTDFSSARSRLLLAGLLTLTAWAPARIFAQVTMPAAGEKLPSYDVAAIKPASPDDNGSSIGTTIDRFTVKNYPLVKMISFAYGLRSDSQVVGGPDWISKTSFNIDAKFDEAEIAKRKAMTPVERGQQARLALQSLLAERFQLKISTGSRVVPAYDLVVTGKPGANLTPHKPPAPTNGGPTAVPAFMNAFGHITANGMPINLLVSNLAFNPEVKDRILFDKTGLTGNYDFELKWTSERGGQMPPDAPYPGLFTALQEQLGLKLVPSNESVETINISSAKLPVFD